MRKITTTLIALLLTLCANAQKLKNVSPSKIGIDSTQLHKKIDSIALAGISAKAFPGCRVFAAKDGKIFFNKSYGTHTYDSITPVKNSDLYDLASVTKIIGPLPALMKLHGEGKIKLDTKFSHYWWRFRCSDKRHFTMREALAHQARLQPWIPYWKMLKNKDGTFKKKYVRTKPSKRFPYKLSDTLYISRKFRRKIYRAIRQSALRKEKKYKYSGLVFYIFPQLIENLSGESYIDYLNTNFYQPLGAKTLCYKPKEKFPLSRIVPTENDKLFRKKLLHGYVHDEGAATMGGISGNAGLFSTADDLAKVMQMYLQGGVYDGKIYIPKATLNEFTKVQYPKYGNRRGLGFDKPLLKNRENGSCAISASSASFGHGGYTGTFVWADPENGLLFVFLSNRVNPTRENSLIYKLNIRPSIHQVFYDLLQNK